MKRAVKSLPTAYLGTMTFGWAQASTPVDDAVVKTFIERFSASGYSEVDCARIYSGGDSEQIVGRVLKTLPDVNVTITTKAHPSQPGGLSPEGLIKQLETSLAALQVDSLNTYYLHQPDTEHPLAASLEVCDSLVKKGTIKEIGMSNYHALELKRTIQLCNENGWTKPGVFQALYNPINRRIEEELIPEMRANGIRLVAYNPLAAGLLTGKHTSKTEVVEGRFKDNKNYLDRFYKDDCFQGIGLIKDACDAANISMLQATFSWLLHHSALQAGDAILLGASNPVHLEANMEAIEKSEPLPEAVVAAFEQAWQVCQEDAFFYWRSYSADMPDRESLHQGASYVVKK